MTLTEASFAGTLPAIQRTTDHRYLWTDPITRQRYDLPGVTGLLDIVNKGKNFDRWRDRTLAEVAYDLSMDGVLSKLTKQMAVAAMHEAVTEPRMTAARLGSEVHRMADELNHGRTPVGSDIALAYATAYNEWQQRSGWRLRLSEAIVINPSQGYGGTLDSLWYDEDGKTVICDVKTGSVWPQAIIQLAAYGMCPLVSPWGSDKVYPMPVPDRYVILNVKPEGVKPIEVHIGQAELMVWADILDIHRWQQTAKGKL